MDSQYTINTNPEDAGHVLYLHFMCFLFHHTKSDALKTFGAALNTLSFQVVF